MGLSLGVTCAIMRQVELDYAEQIGAEFMDFDGQCPFLACVEDEPHKHAICPNCGAVRFGNLYCYACREYHEAVREELALEKMRAREAAEVEGEG